MISTSSTVSRCHRRRGRVRLLEQVRACCGCLRIDGFGHGVNGFSSTPNVAAAAPRAASASGLMFSCGWASVPVIEIPVRLVRNGVFFGSAVSEMSMASDLRSTVPSPPSRAISVSMINGRVVHHPLAHLEIGQCAVQGHILRRGADERAEQAQEIEPEAGHDGAVDLAAFHHQQHVAIRIGQNFFDAQALAAEADTTAGLAGQGPKGGDIDVQPVQ